MIACCSGGPSDGDKSARTESEWKKLAPGGRRSDALIGIGVKAAPEARIGARLQSLAHSVSRFSPLPQHR